jgi:hypothetical protein
MPITVIAAAGLAAALSELGPPPEDTGGPIN